MQRARNLIFLDCMCQLSKANAFDIWSFFDLAKFCVLFARKKWSTNFFKSGLKLSPLFPSMLDKSLKLFLSYHLTIFSHPRTPNSMMKPRTPGSMMCSPCVFASSLNRGCGDSDALRKTFQIFVHDWLYHLLFLLLLFDPLFRFSRKRVGPGLSSFSRAPTCKISRTPYPSSFGKFHHGPRPRRNTPTKNPKFEI